MLRQDQLTIEGDDATVSLSIPTLRLIDSYLTNTCTYNRNLATHLAEVDRVLDSVEDAK